MPRFCEQKIKQKSNKQNMIGTIEDRITRRDVKKKRGKKLGKL